MSETPDNSEADAIIMANTFLNIMQLALNTYARAMSVGVVVQPQNAPEIPTIRRSIRG